MTQKIIKLHEPCPHCPSSDAYCTYEDGHGYCFSCESYDKPKDMDRQSTDHKFSYEYLPTRGISADIFALFDAKTKIDSDGKPVSIGFRYPNGNYKVRLLDDKVFFWKHVNDDRSYGLFGQDKFAAGSHKYVTITEGELDACSLYQSLPHNLRHPTVSVRSASNAVSDCVAERSWINSFERIYIAFDSDAAGREATRNVAQLFDYGKVYDVKFSNRKDPNEYLQHGESQELANIWVNSKPYLPESLTSSLDEFAQLLEERPALGVPYPFPTLTEMTYGIRTGESVLLTAQEGVGKTELMHAIEYQLLTRTDDHVGAIFLEEPPKRNLQALAGLHFKRPVHLPDSGCTPGQVAAAIRKVVQTDDRLYLYRNFGSDDPELLLDTIRFLVSARKCRYILLDHISMVISGLAEEDERRKLDYFSTRSEMMVKELDFALIIVSHVNDYGQTRGSRYIGKVADIRIDAMRDLNSDNPDVRNLTALRVTKNRYCGRTGSAGNLVFDPLTGVYHEQLPSDQYKNIPSSSSIQRKGTKDEIKTYIPMAANDNTPRWTQGKVA